MYYLLFIIITLVSILILYNFDYIISKMYYTAPQKVPKKSTTVQKAPTRTLVDNALSSLNKKNSNGNPPKSNIYNKLVNNEYIYYNGNDKRWYSKNPVGKPPIIPNKPKTGLAFGGLFGQGQLPPNPDPSKPHPVTVGGKSVTNALLQFSPGGLALHDGGKTLHASINPKSKDGSKKYDSTRRNRNEIALRGLKDAKTISFNFSSKGSDNLAKKRAGIFFQIKPPGHSGNDAYIRLGVKDGKLASGIGGADTVTLVGPGGKTYSGSDNNKIEVKMNDGKGALYINRDKVHQIGDARKRDINLPVNDSTNFKLGLESKPSSLGGEFSATYTDINIR